jgi:hypothetical protein
MESSPPNVGGVDAADVGMLPKPEEATEAEEERSGPRKMDHGDRIKGLVKSR